MRNMNLGKEYEVRSKNSSLVICNIEFITTCFRTLIDETFSVIYLFPQILNYIWFINKTKTLICLANKILLHGKI